MMHRSCNQRKQPVVGRTDKHVDAAVCLHVLERAARNGANSPLARNAQRFPDQFSQAIRIDTRHAAASNIHGRLAG